MSTPSFVSELFLTDQFVNTSCAGRMSCDALSDLGPPPDMILSIPPPPIPPFMEDLMSRLLTEEPGDGGLDSDPKFPREGKQCNMCNWSSDNIGFIELAQKGPLIDDTWFLVIISSSVFVALLGIIVAIGFLKYREVKLKPLSDVVLAKKEKALGLERCEAVLYPAPQLPPPDGRSSRALWAGLKPLEGNHYTVDHCQPMDQKPGLLETTILSSDNNYDYADYSSITYTSIDRNVDLEQVHLDSPPNISEQTTTSSSSFENIGFNAGDDLSQIHIAGCNRSMNQAAYLLGAKTCHKSKPISHIYEMVTPKIFSTPRVHKNTDYNLQNIPIISTPTNICPIRFPPLNSRYEGQYTLTAYPNGTHSLARLGSPARIDRKYAHVTLGKSGALNTSLAPPHDIYSTPITSPVI